MHLYLNQTKIQNTKLRKILQQILLHGEQAIQQYTPGPKAVLGICTSQTRRVQ